MTPDRSYNDTVGRVANKVRVFNPYFYVPKYRSSGALPAPEIFISKSFKLRMPVNDITEFRA